MNYVEKQVRAQQPILARHPSWRLFRFRVSFSLAISLLLFSPQRRTIYSLYRTFSCFISIIIIFSLIFFMHSLCCTSFSPLAKSQLRYKKKEIRIWAINLRYDTFTCSTTKQSLINCMLILFIGLCSCLKYTARSMWLCRFAVMLSPLPSQLHFIYIDLN